MPFAKITANALSPVHRRGVQPAAVKEMSLTAQRFPDGSWCSFWQVVVAHAGHEMRSKKTDVLVDISGQVIEQKVRVYEDANRWERSAASEAYADGLLPVG